MSNDAVARIGNRIASDAVWGELDELRAKLRMIISHATGGMMQDIDASTNDICVEISRSKNEVWKHAQEVALRDAALQSLSEWRDISTAPKEHGARFLTFSPDVGMVICDRRSGYVTLAWNEDKYDAATHWMPLPDGPGEVNP